MDFPIQIPETPHDVKDLDLMRRLDAYANGSASWTPGENSVGDRSRQACKTLHTNLTNLVNGIFAYVLDRVTAREMETFTMHDRVHGRKVAHLMWHIMKPERRELLTPPEIGLLVVAAHLHDLGMGLSPAERADRVAPDSDLWDRLEVQESVRLAIGKLREQIGDPGTSESIKRRAEQELFQAEEALLTQDTRERHATKARYEEILGLLSDFHKADPIKIPDIEASLSFDGDSFREKLIDVCMSHNEDADALVSNDEMNIDRPRFPTVFPVGSANSDLHMVAAALRLADILDFDRERTPAVLFHYLLPETLGGFENRSILEWSKHLAVSNWHIERDAVVFRGRSRSHIIHHAVVQFCSVIAEEVKATHATFSPLGETSWPFILPLSVKADIHEEGYRYVPYKFELDDDRVYSLLMGGAIYDNPLVAVRELVQNAVDACKLRDSLTRLHEPFNVPGNVNRITIRYEEPTAQCPRAKLSVTDTGTGMDAYVLERYFLQVGRSYYSSSDFNQTRVQLRRSNLDFAPISEFGIGFLSSFLLADYVEVETAIWESPRGDTAKRTLKIDGPTRLIRLDEHRNDGVGRFKGTRITLYLTPKAKEGEEPAPAGWEEIEEYLRDVCQDLPYVLNLEHVSDGQVTEDRIERLPLTVEVPPHLESAAFRIPVNDEEFGLEGEIVLMNSSVAGQLEKELSEQNLVVITPKDERGRVYSVPPSSLLRGGFKIGKVSGTPYPILAGGIPSTARLRLTWTSRASRRYLTPNIARNSISDEQQVGERVYRLWLTHLLQHRDTLPEGLLYDLWPSTGGAVKSLWLEEFDAFTLYQLARQAWRVALRRYSIEEAALEAWEEGKGSALPYHLFGVCRTLLNLVLPRVTSLQMNNQGEIYVTAPQSDWQSVLKSCRDFVRQPVRWSAFAEYVGDIKDFLMYAHGRGEYLNSRHKDRFTSWEPSECRELERVLNKLLDVRRFGQRAKLTLEEVALLNRAAEVAGELMLGMEEGQWTLNSFAVANNP